jgi:flagellar basal-body rod modification protein FlgD
MDSVTSTTSTNPLTQSSSSTLPQSTSTAQQQQTQFLQLLVAQLQGQNPLDPKDGAEFVTQLAQFSSLEELTTIRTTLQNLLTVESTPPASTNPFQTPQAAQ